MSPHRGLADDELPRDLGVVEPAGDQAEDLEFAVSRATLRDASGARAGSLHATFLVTGGRSPRTTELVTGTIALPDGQITVQGVFANSGDDTDIIPITGGSGRYEAAAGSMNVTSGRRQVTFELKFAQAGT